MLKFDIALLDNSVTTGANGKLFNLARLRAKTKVRHVVNLEILFADDAALVTDTVEDLHLLIDRLSHACKELLASRKEKLWAKAMDLGNGATKCNTRTIHSFQCL